MKVKWGALMVDGRGKIGGQVASKNRSGAYMRNKVTPSNPRSVAQMQARNFLATASAGWSGLTTPERAGFDGGAKDWAGTNIFGDGVTPTGKNLYTKLNINLQVIGSPMISEVPEKVSVPIVPVTGVVIDNSFNVINMPGGVVVVGYVYVVSASAVQSAGTSFFKGKYRVIYTGTALAPGASDIFTAYAEKFGYPVADSNIQFEVKLVDAVTGQAGLAVTYAVSYS